MVLMYQRTVGLEDWDEGIGARRSKDYVETSDYVS